MSDNDNSELKPTADGNHIYFYCDVDAPNALEMVKLLREADATELYQSIKAERKPNAIVIHINSDGGEVPSMWAITNVIQSMQCPTRSIVEGWACSAATAIAMSANERHITQNSVFMIHELQAWTHGGYQQIKDYVKLLDSYMDMMAVFYAKHSKQKKSAIRKMLKRDNWLTAQQALDMGFVDKII